MVAKVGVHDDDKVARDELQAVNVGGAETQLAGSGLEDDVGSVGLDELEGDFLGSVRGAIVDDDQFPVEVPVTQQQNFSMTFTTRRGFLFSEGEFVLLGEHAVQQPCHDREVLSLIEGREDDRVLVSSALGHSERREEYEVVIRRGRLAKGFENGIQRLRSVGKLGFQS